MVQVMGKGGLYVSHTSQLIRGVWSVIQKSLSFALLAAGCLLVLFS